MRNIPSISALRAFELAARLGSFKQAADELGLSASAVSHQIRALEKELGEALFERQSNGIILTEPARTYLKTVRSAFDQLEKGTATIQRRQGGRPLQISLLTTLSTMWLIPELSSFQQKYSAINIELNDSPVLVDFKKSQRFDAAIRYDFNGDARWADLVVHPLVDEYIFPVCSPDFLKQYPEVVDLNWNDQHFLLVNSRHPDEWDRWCDAAGSDFRLKQHSNSTVMDTSAMTLMAARNGLGIALARTPFVDQMMKNMELVRIHRAVQYRGTRHYLVYPTDNANDPSLINFRDWLTETARACNENYAQAFSGAKGTAAE